jgi:hypothetical protein
MKTRLLRLSVSLPKYGQWGVAFLLANLGYLAIKSRGWANLRCDVSVPFPLNLCSTAQS